MKAPTRKELKEKFVEYSEDELRQTLHNLNVEIQYFYNDVSIVNDLTIQVEVLEEILNERGL